MEFRYKNKENDSYIFVEPDNRVEFVQSYDGMNIGATGTIIAVTRRVPHRMAVVRLDDNAEKGWTGTGRSFSVGDKHWTAPFRALKYIGGSCIMEGGNEMD